MEIEEIKTDEEYPLEYQLFALAFRQEGAIERFVKHLSPDEVGAIHGDHGIHEFYVALCDFYKETRLDPVDPTAFRAWLESETDIYDVLGGAGGVDFFIDTLKHMDMGDPESVIKVLRWKANRRQQMNHLQSLQSILGKKGAKSDEDRARISELTEQIRRLESDLESDPLERVCTASDIVANAEHIMEIPDFIPTPFKAYNKALGYDEDTGGYFRGACHAIVALSGKGKSTLTKTLVNHWLDEGYSVLYINFEEAKSHWERILMSQVLKENVYARSAGWTAEERAERMNRFASRLSEWGDRLMVRHDPDSLYFEDLELWLYDIIGHGGRMPDVVVIDTIQSMITKRQSGARHHEFESMMIRLERIAKEMDAAFVITSQQNNDALRDKREVLEQRDVGGSVSIVQKCSVITFITQQKTISGDDSQEEELMQLQIIKNRITGGAFSYDPPLVLYVDESKSYEEWTIPDRDEYEMGSDLAKDVFGLDGFLE